jgi:hypothetical protein
MMPHTPEAAIAEIVTYMARRSFMVTQSGPASATFTRHKKPDWQMIVFLLFLGFLALMLLGDAPLPALALLFLLAVIFVCYLLYFPVVRPTVTTGVTALGSSSGTEIVLSGNDRKARADLTRWILKNATAPQGAPGRPESASGEALREDTPPNRGVLEPNMLCSCRTNAL